MYVTATMHIIRRNDDVSAWVYPRIYRFAARMYQTGAYVNLES